MSTPVKKGPMADFFFNILNFLATSILSLFFSIFIIHQHHTIDLDLSNIWLTFYFLDSSGSIITLAICMKSYLFFYALNSWGDSLANSLAKLSRFYWNSSFLNLGKLWAFFFKEFYIDWIISLFILYTIIINQTHNSLSLQYIHINQYSINPTNSFTNLMHRKYFSLWRINEISVTFCPLLPVLF